MEIVEGAATSIAVRRGLTAGSSDTAPTGFHVDGTLGLIALAEVFDAVLR